MSRVLNAWKLISFCALLTFLAAPTASAQESAASAKTEATMTSPSLTPAQVAEIIRKFTAKETEFRRALNSYAFKRDALVQIIGMGGQVVGEYRRVSDFTFDEQGNRYEKINFFRMPTFRGVTQEDLEDLGGVNPFALE